MQTSSKYLVTLIISFIPVAALAETNTMDGSFRYSLDLFSQGPPLKLTYNSRSLHEGVFGIGWCASFEKRLVYRQNSYWLLDCNLPNPEKISLTKAKQLNLLKVPLLPKDFQIQKSENGFFLGNGKQKIEIILKNSMLQEVKSSYLKMNLKYDKNSNLSILKNLKTQQLEMILYDDQDRVITHHFSKTCFDQIQYQKDFQDQFTTVVERSCQEKNKPDKKEQILYVFSVKLNKKKQQREISSVKIYRDKFKDRNRIAEIP